MLKTLLALWLRSISARHQPLAPGLFSSMYPGARRAVCPPPAGSDYPPRGRFLAAAGPRLGRVPGADGRPLCRAPRGRPRPLGALAASAGASCRKDTEPVWPIRSTGESRWGSILSIVFPQPQTHSESAQISCKLSKMFIKAAQRPEEWHNVMRALGPRGDL